MREAFPWARVMQLGLGVLHLPPEVFWRMTLRELVAAFGRDERGLERGALERLIADWPD